MWTVATEWQIYFVFALLLLPLLARLGGPLRGVLLASGHPKLFSPGLDLVTLVGYDRGAMERFMLRFAELAAADRFQAF